MDWSAEGWRSAFRIELRVQAIGLASRGWPVLPGTYPTHSRWIGAEHVSSTDGDSGADGPVPVHRDWQNRLGADPDEIAAWWLDRPYSLLLATGPAVEAIEVGPELGRRAAVALRARGVLAPIAATPHGRWYFLTPGGQRLAGELAESADIRLHSTGSWLPMPPSTFPRGVMHWRVKPQVCGWVLPAPEAVQDALRTALQEHEGVAGLVASGR